MARLVAKRCASRSCSDDSRLMHMERLRVMMPNVSPCMLMDARMRGGESAKGEHHLRLHLAHLRMTEQAAGGLIWGPRSVLKPSDPAEDLAEIIEPTWFDSDLPTAPTVEAVSDMSAAVRDMSELLSTLPESAPSAEQSQTFAEISSESDENLPDSDDLRLSANDAETFAVPDVSDAPPMPGSGKVCQFCGLPGSVQRRLLGRGRKKKSTWIQRAICFTCLRRRAISPELRAIQDEARDLDQPLGYQQPPALDVQPFVPEAWMLDYLLTQYPVKCTHCGRLSNEKTPETPVTPVVSSGVISVPAPQWRSGPTILPRRSMHIGPRPLVEAPRPPRS